MVDDDSTPPTPPPTTPTTPTPTPITTNDSSDNCKQWSVYQEIIASAIGSAAIFSVAKIRDMARKGQLEAPELLQMPLPLTTLLHYYEHHHETLQTLMAKNDFDLNMLNFIQQQLHNTADLKWLGSPSQAVQAAVIHHFGDERSTKECVYCISTNAHTKQILLCFRGSITAEDWRKDSKMAIGRIQNPLHGQPDQPKNLFVHLGFREYLYNATIDPTTNDKDTLVQEPTLKITSAMIRATRNLVRANDFTRDMLSTHPTANKFTTDGVVQAVDSLINDDTNDDIDEKKKKPRSKLHTILQQLHELSLEHPDYSIRITGHSLGGALAQLVALEAAVLFGTPAQPVTYVGLANPRAGTTSVRHVVETLERQQKLRHLAVHNQYDGVPMEPHSWLKIKLFPWKIWPFRYDQKYAHSGIRLCLLEPPTGYTVRYHGDKETYLQKIKRKLGFRLRGLSQPYKVAGRHHILTYVQALQKLKEPLSNVTLGEWYNEKLGMDLYPKVKVGNIGASVDGDDGDVDVGEVEEGNKAEERKETKEASS